MSIVRISKTENYSVIANQPINDQKLSWGARGMLAYLLSKPNDWQVSMTDLEKKSPAGAHATRSLVKELEIAGYMVRKRIQTEGGKFTWITTVYETIPQLSIDGLSIDGKVPSIVIPESLNTKLNKGSGKKGKKEKPVFSFPDLLASSPEFMEAWNEFVEHRAQMKKKLTPLAAQRLLAKLCGYALPVSVVALQTSVERGWLGVFPESVKPVQPGQPDRKTTITENGMYI